MSSLLTNNSAMVALQTLKTINKDMGMVQNEISTGKRIATARDNAALWGISTTMQTDVSGFKAISESLSLGTATLTVGRDAAETIAGLLDQLKGKIVAAQEENVDRFKIQADVDALRDQIRSVRGAAQFNGLNLIDKTDTISILASLDRDSYGNVEARSIQFDTHDLSEDQAIFGGGTDRLTEIGLNAEQVGAITTKTGVNLNNTSRTTSLGALVAGAVGHTVSLTIDGIAVNYTLATTTAATEAAALAAAISAAGITGITGSNTGAAVELVSARPFDDLGVTWSTSNAGTTINALQDGTDTAKSRATEVTLANYAVVAGDSYRIQLGSVYATFTAKAGDTTNDIVKGLKIAVDALNIADVSTRVEVDSSDRHVLKIDKSTTGNIALTVFGSTGGTRGGGLFGLQSIDVTTRDGAEKALSNVEAYIQASISAAAEFGSGQGRIDTQSDFVSKIMDGLTSGIGALVDADMEAASARLQALQVQQQLGIQALSIANQQPQNILALFRQ